MIMSSRPNFANAAYLIQSITILIQDHLPQFAPKVMAHFSAALERKSLRKDALRAWLIFVQVIAKHSNEYLSRIAGQIVVTMLPYLQNSDQENQNSADDHVASIWIFTALRYGRSAGWWSTFWCGTQNSCVETLATQVMYRHHGINFQMEESQEKLMCTF